tara:strand:+ start:211 stop:366 length:156 start_codon:yes stop_codon:yes gene_type:complete
MTLYEFSFQHPNVAEIMWDYQDCVDIDEAQQHATARAKELNYNLIDIKEAA